MIPTVLVPGLLLGRWWYVPLAAVAWAAVLYIEGTVSGAGGVLGAAGLAALNAVVAVGVRQVLSRWIPNPVPGR
jgi:hypothetical protein